MKSIKTSENGFTLTELMIAMLISLIIGAGAIQLFQHSLNSVNKANEIQRRQQTLLATIEHLLPRIRQASAVTMSAHPSGDPGDPPGLSVTRKTSGISPGYDCKGTSLAALPADTTVTEFYYSDGTDLLCYRDGDSEIVAFDITDILLATSYQDDDVSDGRFDPYNETAHVSSFPTTDDVLGVQIEITQPMPDGERTIPIHVALRNNVLSARNQNGDFDNASGN